MFYYIILLCKTASTINSLHKRILLLENRLLIITSVPINLNTSLINAIELKQYYYTILIYQFEYFTSHLY